MESKIIEEKKNPFLSRTEYTVELKSESAPSESEVREVLGKDEALTVVKKINTNFGRQSFLVEAVVYDSVEDREKIEVIPKKIKKKMAEEKKKAEEEARKKAEAEAKAAEEAAKAAAEASSEENAEEKTE